MKLCEFDFSKVEAVRKRCILFARDGNKVVHHYKDLFPVDAIVEEAGISGFYIERNVCDGQTDFRLWNDCDEEALCYDYLTSYWEPEEIKEFLRKYERFAGRDGFIQYLRQFEEFGWYINLVHITLLQELGEEKLAQHYAAYRDRYIAARQQRKEKEEAERERQRKEEEAAQAKAIEEQVAQAEEKIRRRETVSNEDCGGTALILALMRRHGINPPLRTAGWINNSMAELTFDADGEPCYRYYRRKKRDKGSQAVFPYLRQLRDAVA